MMFQSVFNPKLQFIIIFVSFFCSNIVSADVVDCTPTRVRSMAKHMDTRCLGIDRWFVAQRSTTKEETGHPQIKLRKKQDIHKLNYMYL